MTSLRTASADRPNARIRLRAGNGTPYPSVFTGVPREGKNRVPHVRIRVPEWSP